MKHYLAIDIGASGGRHIAGHMENGRLHTREVYRFANAPVKKDGALCWDIDGLFAHVVEGMKKCREEGIVPSSVGIDTWAVDFVLLDKQGKRLGEAVCYRDGRTEGMLDAVENIVSAEELYSITGIQRQPFNTIYQLMAVERQMPAMLEKASALLMIPEYLHYQLSGNIHNEYTNATSTALVDASKKTWDRGLIRRLGYPEGIFGPLYYPGDAVGCLLPEIAEKVGYDCLVRLPATHDTASAFVSVPAKAGDDAYLSSGTWSLLGMESKTPILSEAARLANFTNEGGYAFRYRFLKNIMGLWMLQSVRRELGSSHSYPELAMMARSSPFSGRVDVNDAAFMAPDSMIDAIAQVCARMGQPVPASAGETLECIYRSLAESYAEALRQMELITGRRFSALHIVGGGCQDAYLNQLTAQYTHLPVYAGPVEGTVIGNLVVQMLADGELQSITEARAVIAESFPVQKYVEGEC